MDKKILLIVEGENDEVDFFTALFNKCSKTTKYVFYPYKTNIHILAQTLYNEYNDFDTVKRMINYFTDSTNQGRLFINYPMMQSYKHFSILPDSNYEFLNVSLENIKNYKEYVGSISNYKDITKYNYIIFYSIIIHNLKKANKLINGIYEIPIESKYNNFNYSKLFEEELSLFVNKGLISVLNTCVFSLIDFAPKKFFNFIIKQKDGLLI